jgi:hypothetical protein
VNGKSVAGEYVLAPSACHRTKGGKQGKDDPAWAHILLKLTCHRTKGGKQGKEDPAGHTSCLSTLYTPAWVDHTTAHHTHIHILLHRLVMLMYLCFRGTGNRGFIQYP